MSAYFLTTGNSIQRFAGDLHNDEEAILVYSNLKHVAHINGDLLSEDDGSWRAFDVGTGGWMDVPASDVYGSIGLPVIDGDLRSKYDAALEHIQELESKLDAIQEAMNHTRGFERKLQEMLDAFSSEELLEEAFDGIDPDYTPFSQQEE